MGRLQLHQPQPDLQPYPQPNNAPPSTNPYPPQNLQQHAQINGGQPAPYPYPSQHLQQPQYSPVPNSSLNSQFAQTGLPRVTSNALVVQQYTNGDVNSPLSPFQRAAVASFRPQINNVPIPTPGAWSSGLFDCMNDPTNAFTTLFFPCGTFGQIAEVLDNGHTTCITSGIIYAILPCVLSFTYRRKMRRLYGLVEAPAPDWVAHSIFEWCALCQEYRELTSRGINPALGWQGNVNQVPQVTMAPPMNQTMG